MPVYEVWRVTNVSTGETEPSARGRVAAKDPDEANQAALTLVSDFETYRVVEIQQDAIAVVCNGVSVALLVERDADGNEYVRLEAANGALEGEEPGLYYPRPRAEA